ncbi:glycosyltransferase family 2 protein [Enterococcus casseliflavus]|uniref:glycosyltransferase family 2 protein n=1 Tax=Enterococcus casseliflavus TaxID=37734 RepID=UPI003D150A52
MEKVSCVITTVNREKELFRAVNSCLFQTYKNIEVVIVIDGRNNSLKNKIRLEFISNKNVRVEETGKKVGGNAARNFGINLADGEYIALLDDDDEWLDTKIEKQLKEIKKQSEMSVIFCSVFNLLPNNKVKILPLKKYNGVDSISKFLFDTYYFFRGAGFVQTSTLFSYKSVFMDNPFDEKLKKHQDWDWAIKCNYNGVVFKHINEPLVNYHNESQLNRVGHNSDFELTITWLENIQHYITKKEYDRIVYSVLIKKIYESTDIDKNRKEILIKNYTSIIQFKSKLSIAYIYNYFIKLK